MPTWRKFHTKITESIDFNEMPDDFTRLLWVLLPLGLDKEGRCLDNVGLVKAKTMPLREDVSPGMIAEALEFFEQVEMIERYKVKGRGYFCLPTFNKHQGKRDKEADSSLPPPPSHGPGSGPGHGPNGGAGGEIAALDVDVDVERKREKNPKPISKSVDFADA